MMVAWYRVASEAAKLKAGLHFSERSVTNRIDLMDLSIIIPQKAL